MIFGANGKKTSKTRKKKIEWVNSIHIIVNDGTIYEDGKVLLSHIKNYDEWTIEPDYQPYSAKGKRQLFRLPYCSKEGEDRPFKLLTIEDGSVKSTDLEDPKIDEWMVSSFKPPTITAEQVEQVEQVEHVKDSQLWELFVKTSPLVASAFVFDKEITEQCLNNERTTINTKRVAPSHCDICDRTHDNDNTLYLLGFPSTNQLMRGCIRKKKEMKFVSVIDKSIDGEILNLNDTKKTIETKLSSRTKKNADTKKPR